jgi:hypothetical protein
MKINFKQIKTHTQAEKNGKKKVAITIKHTLIS